jgi:rSAM/selenodomain-associated transferase 1
MQRALIVMAKEPKVGETKTRLSPHLSGQEAAGLYRCFLLDTLELMRQVKSTQPVIAYSPPESESFFRSIAPAGFRFIPQVGASLGERLNNAMSQYLSAGYDQAVAIDSDSPTLPVAHLRRAFQVLDDPAVDVILGPCEDGGYYLIGLKTARSELFRGIIMSTPTVLEETVERGEGMGLRVALLPPWYDVDTRSDLDRLVEELQSRPDHTAWHTRHFLTTLVSRADRSLKE